MLSSADAVLRRTVTGRSKLQFIGTNLLHKDCRAEVQTKTSKTKHPLPCHVSLPWCTLKTAEFEVGGFVGEGNLSYTGRGALGQASRRTDCNTCSH